MTRSKLFFFIIILLISSAKVFADCSVVDKKTFIYAIKGSDTLRLDRYECDNKITNKPCVIFVFGGGFYTGARDVERNVEYMKRLAESGYVAVAIDYRLGFKDIKAKPVNSKKGMIDLFGNTIKMAVEDLFDATTFVYSHANEWNIDKDLIIANGSSSGAITVLQAEYNICNKTMLAKRLPEGFNYAGVISFAGAIYSDEGKLQWNSTPCPIQLFHGTADSIVPFRQLSIFKYHFCGSEAIASQLAKMKKPYYFYTVENASHEISHKPMTDNIDEINEFISRYIIKKGVLIIAIDEKTLNVPPLRKKLKLKDYIKANIHHVREANQSYKKTHQTADAAIAVLP